MDSERVTSCISDLASENAAVRRKAAYDLVEAAEAGLDIARALPSLARALADPEAAVRQEAVWALFCLVSGGTDIEPAVPGLEKCLTDSNGSVCGNGALALASQHCRRGRPERAETMLDSGQAPVVFGATWALTDCWMRAGDREKLKTLIRRVRPGIGDVDQAIRQGYASAIVEARRHGADIGPSLAALQEALAEAGDDALKQAQVYGFMMKLQQAGLGNE